MKKWWIHVLNITCHSSLFFSSEYDISSPAHPLGYSNDVPSNDSIQLPHDGVIRNLTEYNVTEAFNVNTTFNIMLDILSSTPDEFLNESNEDDDEDCGDQHDLNDEYNDGVYGSGTNRRIFYGMISIIFMASWIAYAVLVKSKISMSQKVRSYLQVS